MNIFLDVTRIVYRMIGSTPTGIDRVEYAYAKAIMQNHAGLNPVSVFTAPVFTGSLNRDLTQEVLTLVEKAWRLRMPAENDPVYQAVRLHLATPIAQNSAPQNARFRDPQPLRRMFDTMFFPAHALMRSPTRLRRRVRRLRGQSAIYLNTSHNQLETPKRLSWAAQAPSVKSVFFFHDTIPVDYPEFVAPSSPARHARRLLTISEMASLVIVNSDTTRHALVCNLQKSRLRVPDIEVLPLGVADTFLNMRHTPSTDQTGPATHPYFVTLSTIEPRKNMLFLFAVWRRLVQRYGARAPRLVVVGARGWEYENVVDVLERSRELGPFLVEVSDLCDASLADLLKGARGLLQPSSVEGFGLPLIEGLTLGLPVIASDIPAHREVAQGYAELVDPIDGPLWLAAIEGLMDPDSSFRTKTLAAGRSFVPMDWPTHVAKAIDLVQRHGSPPK